MRLPRALHSSIRIVRTRLNDRNPGMSSGNKENNSESELLYAANDFVVMTVVVPLLVALEGIHHCAGGPLSGPVPMARQTPLANSASYKPVVVLSWQRLVLVPLRQCVQVLRPLCP